MNFLGTLTATIIVALSLSNPAFANPFYGKVEAGFIVNTEVEGFELDSNSVYGAALGTTVGPVRVEAGANRLNFDVFPGVTADATNYSATAYADFQLTERSAVYVGGGVDYIQAEVNAFGTSIDTEGSGWHATAGYSRRIGNGIIADFGARYLSADLDGLNAEAVTATAGLRFAL